jgi:hypothetical protein
MQQRAEIKFSATEAVEVSTSAKEIECLCGTNIYGQHTSCKAGRETLQGDERKGGPSMKNAAFWDLTPCGSCKNRRFGGTYCLHHQGNKIGEIRTTLVLTTK